MEAFWTNFVNLVDGWKLITLFVLIGIDFAAGVILAIKNHEFELSQIGRFLNTSVLYLLGGYVIVGALCALGENTYEGIVVTTWALIDATMLGAIYKKIKQLGVPLPDQVGFLKFTK